MKKIISLFKRNYSGDRLACDEIVAGAEWVIEGDGIATVKYDGTCCLIRDGKFYKRYDRKMIRKFYKQLKANPAFEPKKEHYKAEPPNWEAAEHEPNHNTGHWPGWVLVGDGPEDQWHNEAWSNYANLHNGTWELVGPKIQANPYRLENHELWPHGVIVKDVIGDEPPRLFKELKETLEVIEMEGFVWHHPDGRMVKIKRSDFGFLWPSKV